MEAAFYFELISILGNPEAAAKDVDQNGQHNYDDNQIFGNDFIHRLIYIL
jgi:hypothetical protein